jgi:phosphoenolpyruvate phosphomutase
VVKIGQQLPREQAHGEFIGMAMFSEKGTQALRECYHRVQKQHESSPFHESASLSKASFTDMLQELIDQGHHTQAVPIFKGWMEVDSFEEYQKAWAKIRQ